jgi:hypothetical protein
MAVEFVLRPAKLREGKFVPQRKAELLTMSWAEVVGRLAPSRSRESAILLRHAHPGMFVGTRTRGAQATTFAFDAAGRSRDAAQVLRRDPTFEKSVIEVFLVERVDWGMELQELGAA